MSSEYTNINICLVGCVSAGKSTILNAFFGQDYAQCKIKRTTMMPNKFIETNNVHEINSFDSINQTIFKVNKQIYEQTQIGTQLSLSDYGTELTFFVGSMEMNVNNKLKICVYDIPGLNDARTKDVYYNYLKTNFHKFNIILFVVDIKNGLNTSDEMDILNFLSDNIDKHKKESNKNISLLTVVNKADDMQLNGDNLEVLGELGEMFEQTSNTIKQVFTKIEMQSNLVGCIPICGLDAHLYRMIKKFKDINKLTDENILRIGINEEGSKFRKYTKDAQRSKVQAKLLDTEFVDDMIKLSGFSQIENALNDFIMVNGKTMVRENTFYEYDKLPKMTLDNMIDNLKSRVKLLLPLFDINDDTYSSEMSKVVKQMNTLIYGHINRTTHVNTIKEFYDNSFIKPIVSDKILWREISNFLDLISYPSYLTDRILEIICLDCCECIMHISCFLEYVQILENIHILNTKVVEILFTSIMSNSNCTETFLFDHLNINEIIAILEKLKKYNNFSHFLTFLVANYINNQITDPFQLTTVLLFLIHVDEVLMRQFVSDLRIEKGLCSTKKSKQAYFSTKKPEEIISPDAFKLLNYYIENLMNCKH